MQGRQVFWRSFWAPRAVVRSFLPAAVFAAVVLSVWAVPQGRAGEWRRRSGQNAYAAQRNRLIGQIRTQVDSARKVLATAQSKTKMSEADLKSAREKLDEARSAIDKAEQEHREAGGSLRRIESEILAAQGPDSELGKARAKVDALRAALDRELHRVVKLPEHPAAPSEVDVARDMILLGDADREALRTDRPFQEASARLEEAKREYSRIRTRLLESSPDWVAAAKTAQEARQKESQARKDAAAAAGPSRAANRELRTQKQLATEAQAVVAQGEAALRRLGVKDVGAKGKGTSSSGKKK